MLTSTIRSLRRNRLEPALGVLVTALTTLTVAVAVSAPADADAPTEFRMPSGNVFCQYTTGTGPRLRCDIGKISWTNQEQSPSCDVLFGHTVELTPGTAPSFVCAHDTMLADVNVAELAYGSKATLGPFTCDSTERALHCVEHVGGHTFTLAQEFYGLS